MVVLLRNLAGTRNPKELESRHCELPFSELVVRSLRSAFCFGEFVAAVVEGLVSNNRLN